MAMVTSSPVRASTKEIPFEAEIDYQLLLNPIFTSQSIESLYDNGSNSIAKNLRHHLLENLAVFLTLHARNLFLIEVNNFQLRFLGKF